MKELMMGGDNILEKISSETYNAADRPFDFVEKGTQTALVCNSDETARSMITGLLKTAEYLVTESVTVEETLRSMRFHVYHLVILDEAFGGAVDAGQNQVLDYLSHLTMAVRRNTFVVLLSRTHRTSDNMAAFNLSANLIINDSNMTDFMAILDHGISENQEFYRVFRESMMRLGRL
ncbi:MAG: hypothetical protein NT072_08245 [Deltaproteobacteria bacterium]|nr:hypothetical protein [Deltaproteobacteria bacterium]